MSSGSLIDAIARAAQRNPGSIAVSDGSTSISYQQLVETADHVAANLLRVATEGDRIALHLPRGAQAVVAMLGIVTAGMAYVPLDTRGPPERKRQILIDAAPRVVVTSEAIPACDVPQVRASELTQERRKWDRSIGGSSRSPMYVIYTSGSTGVPKGVVVSKSNVANLVKWHLRTFPLGIQKSVSQFASLGFDASVWEIWPCLAGGARLEVVPEAVRMFPHALARWIDDKRVTQCFLPTQIAESTLPYLEEQPGRLQWLLTGGDRLRRFPPRGLQARLINAYGPTEGTVLATAGEIGPASPGSTSLPTVGTPIAGVAVHLLDNDFAPVPLGDVGEICIAGAGVAIGYLRNPPRSESPFRSWNGARIYRTGDYGRWTSSGELQFVGRTDQQVKVDGIRIELGEVEASVLRVVGVTGAAVFHLDGEVVSFVTGTAEPSDIRAEVMRRVPRNVVPKVVLTDVLPETASGKVDRASLRKLLDGWQGQP